jgi:hypothetical protein
MQVDAAHATLVRPRRDASFGEELAVTALTYLASIYLADMPHHAVNPRLRPSISDRSRPEALIRGVSAFSSGAYMMFGGLRHDASRASDPLLFT